MGDVLLVDSSCLVVLAKAGLLELLRATGERVLVPTAVIEEIHAHGADVVTAAVGAAPWIEVVPSPPIGRTLALWALGAGESAVLASALELPGAVAVLDDRLGRRCAVTLGLRVRGTFGTVLRAKQIGAIPAARPAVEALIRAGLYLTDDLVQLGLAEVGEAPE